MTTIDTSKASRELDIWLAENIQNAYVGPIDWSGCDGYLYASDEDTYRRYKRDGHTGCEWGLGNGDAYCLPLPNYSKGIVSAMQLIDKLIADDADWELGYTCPNDITPKEKWGWYAELILPSTYTGSWPTAHADTLPLAICKALYKWKEGKT